jgi:hypothetical protein
MDYKDNSKAKARIAKIKGFNPVNELYDKEKKKPENFYMIINGHKVKIF